MPISRTTIIIAAFYSTSKFNIPVKVTFDRLVIASRQRANSLKKEKRKKEKTEKEKRKKNLIKRKLISFDQKNNKTKIVYIYDFNQSKEEGNRDVSDRENNRERRKVERQGEVTGCKHGKTCVIDRRSIRQRSTVDFYRDLKDKGT